MTTDSSGPTTELTAVLRAFKVDIQNALHRQTCALVGVILAQGAFIIAVL